MIRVLINGVEAANQPDGLSEATVMPNSFRNYTGIIEEYTRNVTDGKTQIRLNAKNV